MIRRFAWVVMAGCGAIESTADSGMDATIDSQKDGDAAIVDASTDHSPPQYPIVDGSGDCAPAYAAGDASYSSCCNNQPCVGFCVALDDGGIGCSCFGVPDGCDQNKGLVCCRQGRACTAKGTCYYIK